MEEPVLGIDLGTTYCCMGVYRRGKVEIISNELGHPTTPSYVFIDEDGEDTIGKIPKDQAFLHPSSTIFDVKRLIGLPYSEPSVQADLLTWPFEVILQDSVPKIRVHGRAYRPEEISSKILRHLKQIAEDYLGTEVRKAVITVPAYFNDQQRQATKHAGELANLEVLRILNEPTAAAIAYCHQSQDMLANEETNLVFDLGGGTFDIAVLTIDPTAGRKIRIRAVGGDAHLGGEDFDNELVSYCVREIERLYKVKIFNNNSSDKDSSLKMQIEKNLRRLKVKCEQEKINLSSAKKVTLTMDAFYESLDVQVTITRDAFNSINSKYFKKCIRIMDQVLKDAKLDKSDIDKVLLVGGSSRIPALQDMIKDYFEGKKHLSRELRGDEAVAYGAAVHGSALNFYGDDLETRSKLGLDISVMDVVPLPIGIEAYRPNTQTLYFDIIIEKNTPIPCSCTKTFLTRHEGHKPVIIIRQGEDEGPSWKNNCILGRFRTRNLPDSCPANEPVQVTMSVTEDGILTVSSAYHGTELTDELCFDELRLRLSKEEIVQLQRKKLEAASG